MNIQWRMLICSLLFFSLLTISSNGIKADSHIIVMQLSTNKSDAVQNTQVFNETINKADSSTKLIVKIPAGIYYFSDSLYLKSNVELKGDSKNNTKLVLNRAIATEAVHEKMSSGLGAKNISISDLTLMFNEDKGNVDTENLIRGNIADDALINISNRYYNADEVEAQKREEFVEKYADYLNFNNIYIHDVVFDGNLKGGSALNLSGVDGAVIENNEFKNTGLKDGIDITYSKNINVTKNDFINMGRSAIFIFWGNQEIKVENNQIKNWMQRYGLYHYYLMERKNIPQENMSDAAIYAYGPANKEISVSHNKITLVDEANGASNPNNTVLENILGSAVFKEKFKQDNADQIPRYTYYSAIRFKGTTDSVAENNYINIPSPDVHHFFAVDERSFATDKGGIKTTIPQNIIFKKKYTNKQRCSYFSN